MKNPLAISIIAILFALTLLSCSDDKDDSPMPDQVSTPAQLTTALTDIYNDSDAPGFAVSVVKNDAVIYQQAFGKADLEANRAYTNQTTQPIGSISKTFVAAAIVKAIEEGHFDLETDINDILPVALVNPKNPGAVIRVKHLVTHTSGLLDNYEAYFQAYHILPGENLDLEGAQLMQDGFGIQQRETLPLEDFLAEYYFEDGDLYSPDNFATAAPGTQWAYSNIATSLAAYLVETATGTPFREYIQTHILQPLGMNQTAYDAADLDQNQMAKLYWEKDTPLPKYANDSYPDGSINTSNEDLSRFLLDMMRGAKGQSTTLFSQQGYAMLFEALLPTGIVPAMLGENYGVFWALNGSTIHHDGSDPGTTCNLQFDKSSNTGYLLLTNMDASIDEHEAAYFDLAGKVSEAIDEFVQAN